MPYSRPVVVAILASLMGLGVVTHGRARVWHSELSLWSDAVKVSPQKPRPWINLGLALEASGDVDGGMYAHQTALALSFQPRLSVYQQKFSRVASETNIARILAQSGHEQEALRLLNDVLARHPLFPHARFNRGVLLTRLGRCEDALPDFALAMKLDAGFQVPPCR